MITCRIVLSWILCICFVLTAASRVWSWWTHREPVAVLSRGTWSVVAQHAFMAGQIIVEESPVAYVATLKMQTSNRHFTDRVASRNRFLIPSASFKLSNTTALRELYWILLHRFLTSHNDQSLRFNVSDAERLVDAIGAMSLHRCLWHSDLEASRGSGAYQRVRASWPELSSAVLDQLYCVMASRSWQNTAWLSHRLLGVGWYPQLAHLQHSCAPNADFYFHRHTLRLVARRSISSGEPLTVARLPCTLSSSWREREAPLSMGLTAATGCSSQWCRQEAAYSLQYGSTSPSFMWGMSPLSAVWASSLSALDHSILVELMTRLRSGLPLLQTIVPSPSRFNYTSYWYNPSPLAPDSRLARIHQWYNSTAQLLNELSRTYGPVLWTRLSIQPEFSVFATYLMRAWWISAHQLSPDPEWDLSSYLVPATPDRSTSQVPSGRQLWQGQCQRHEEVLAWWAATEPSRITFRLQLQQALYSVLAELHRVINLADYDLDMRMECQWVRENVDSHHYLMKLKLAMAKLEDVIRRRFASGLDVLANEAVIETEIEDLSYCLWNQWIN
eukprot:TRINITY_DN15171_c0_g1_i4.p1 TRINITY_DN15171_c0_g1~~TRINITY_DN15171_c0_g1_i4.p1  ORF type:complete len:558 (-),score=67.23 TRINITY_DN15171_c0_g1_i4:152-1825(-)